MLSAGLASLEKRDFDAFSSSMSAVVQELYAGLPAALSSERPARVLGANPEAFVLSCGGLPSEHQRTHGIRPSSSPERLDPPGQTSLSVGDNEGQNGGGGTATPASVSSPPREGADILEEEEEEDSETPGPLRTQENGEPRSNLPYAETPTSLQNLDEAKEPPVAENASRSGEETRGRTVNGDGVLSSAGDAFPNSGDGFLLYGGEDVKTFSDNCARRDEENNACFTLENRTTADDADSPFGIAPWDETADVVKVVCETDESDGETLEIGFLEEWASETKMEESASPAASCADLYGGDGEQQTDHSYSRRDEKDAETHNGTAVRRDDGDKTDENGVSLVAAANSGALENGVSPLHADSSDCDQNSGEGGFPPMIRERNRRIRDERKLPSASQNGGSSEPRHGAEVAPTKDDTAEARSKGGGVRDPCLSDLCSALEERYVMSEIEKDPKVSTKMDATSVEMKDIFAPNGAIVELDKDGLSKAVVKEGGPICQVETQLFANDFTQTLLHRAQEVRISKEEQLEDLTQTLLHTAQEICKSEEPQIEDLTKTLLHTAQEVCHSEEQQVDEVTQSLLHTAQQIFNSEEQQVEEITPTLLHTAQEISISEEQQVKYIAQTLPHKAQAICIPEEQQVDDITQTLLHTAQETFISGEQQVEDITQPLLHTAQEICNSEEQQVEDLTQTLLHTPQEICHSEEPQVEDVTQTLLHTAQEICNSEEQQAEDISEEQQVEDLTQTLLHTAQEVCHPEEQQVEDLTQSLLHTQEVCHSEEPQVEDLTQTLLHTAQEVCHSEEQQGEDLTQTLLHTPQEVCHPEEPQVEDVTQTLLHTAQEICNSEEQQVEDHTQTLLHTAQEICHSEEQQVEDLTQTLLHTAQEVCNSEEPQVEDVTQTLLHTAQKICNSEEQQVEDLTQTLLHTAQEVCHSEEQQGEDLTQTLLHTPQEVCHPEEQQVEDLTQTLLHTAQEVCHSEEQQVEDVTQTLLHTAQEVCHSEEQQVDDLTQTLLHTPQEVCHPEEQQVEDLTQTLLHTAQEVCHSEEQQVEDVTQTLLHTAQEVCHSEEQQVDDLTQTLLHTPQEICNSEEPEVEDLTQTLLHTAQEVCHSEEQQVEDVTQALLHTAQEVCHSEEQQVEDLTQTLLHTPQEVCHSEEQQVEDLTQTLLHTPQEVCHSEEQQVEDLTQTLLHTPQEIHHSEEPQVEDVTQTLLHTPQEICHSEEQQVEDISEEQQVEDVTQTLLNTPQDICNSEEQQVDDLTQTLLHTPQEISISEEQQVEDVTQTLLHTAQEICHSEEPQVEDLTQSLLHRAQEICHSKEQQIQDITQTLLHTAQEISMSEEQVEDLTQTLLRTPEESRISASKEQQVKDVTQTLLHAAQETQIRISEDQQVEDVTQTLLHPPEETQISNSEEQLVEDVTQTLLHTPEETELCISVDQQVEDVTQTLLRTPEETQNGVPEEQQVDDVTQTAAILGEETQTQNGSRCVIGDEERTTKAAKTKRPSKRRRTLEIGRHLCAVSFPTAVKPAQRRPSSGSVVPNTENGGLTRPKRPKALIEAESPRSGNLRSPAPNFCAPSQCAYAIPCGKRLRILRTCPEKSSLTVAAPRLVRKRPPPSDFGPQLLSPAQFPVAKNARVTIWDRAPKLDVFKPSGRAKEAAILGKMSLLADKLLAPAVNRQTSAPLSAPEKYGHFGNKMVPKLFAGTKLRWPWIDADGGSDGVFEKFSSPSFWIYSLELAAMFAFELSGKTPFAASSSYHAKMASVSAESLQSVAYGSAWREPRARPPSEWSFSFLVSQNAAGVAPVLSLPPPSGPDATKDGSYAVARRASGLQTVLALFFPGCWRLLARKWRPAVKFPSVRRLAFLRFAGASKDSSAQLFATSRSAFGGELPSWDRLDPSSEISPFRSPRGADWTPATLPTPQGAFALHNRWELAFSASFPKYLPIPETARSSRLALPPPGFSARPSDEPDAPVPAAFPESDASPREDGESEKKPKKVSQIRIRKTVPKPDPNLTPMGLPRPKRLKKTEFSLEEIYTNKNYKSPPATRSLETIFEEPKERNGSLIAVSHQKRKRILEFQDFTAPRKRKARSRVKVTGAGGFTRAQKAASEGRELDGLLIQRLTDLETFLAAQEEMADAPGS